MTFETILTEKYTPSWMLNHFLAAKKFRFQDIIFVNTKRMIGILLAKQIQQFYTQSIYHFHDDSIQLLLSLVLYLPDF